MSTFTMIILLDFYVSITKLAFIAYHHVSPHNCESSCPAWPMTPSVSLLFTCLFVTKDEWCLLLLQPVWLLLKVQDSSFEMKMVSVWSLKLWDKLGVTRVSSMMRDLWWWEHFRLLHLPSFIIMSEQHPAYTWALGSLIYMIEGDVVW